MPANTAPSGDMSIRQLSDWAEGQARRLAANFGLDPGRDKAHFALVQAVKLGEEVGELHAEVLGALRYQRYQEPHVRAGLGSDGGSRKAGGPVRSSALSGEAAAASLAVSGGRFHFCSTSLSTEVWSSTSLQT